MKKSIFLMLLIAMFLQKSSFAMTRLPTISCPEVQNIQQQGGEHGGFVYTATATNNYTWAGENPIADEEDLSVVSFRESYITGEKTVSCDYVGSAPNVGMRMSLTALSAVRPVGTVWENERQSDGRILPHCTAGATQCSFEIN
ncbi:MAG: DUF3757 domain-containing protein [Candidatus Phlomobacter fragariae]